MRKGRDGENGMEKKIMVNIGPSDQLSRNKFFDPSTPSMRKGRDGKKSVVQSCFVID